MLHVEAGWNLLSLPVEAVGLLKGTVFPTASSEAFIYGDFYQAVDTLPNGRGFWLKFPDSATIPIRGTADYTNSTPIFTGWNLIGSITTPVAVNTFHSDPPGAVTSSYYGFTPGEGYTVADTLWPGKGYWVKANAAGGIGYLAINTMNIPCPAEPTMWDGNRFYNTVQIGGQCWMSENMNWGTMIPQNTWATDNGVPEKWCYQDDSSNCEIYGGYYQWNEIMYYDTTPGNIGACPKGWHVPHQADYQVLIDAVGTDPQAYVIDGEGTNWSGFSALLTGFGVRDGFSWSGFGSTADLWSADLVDPTHAYGLRIFTAAEIQSRNIFDGRTYRCIRD